MEILKKLTTMVGIMALATAVLMPFSGKHSKAADLYLDAQAFPPDGVWGSKHYQTGKNKEQYYQITIPSDGEFRLQLMSYSGDSFWGSLKWELYNADLSIRIANGEIRGSEEAPEIQSAAWVLSAGTYYYRVYTDYGTGKYKLCGEFTSYGVNDQSALSYDSPLDYQLGDTITGALTRMDREDWYKIVIPSEGYYAQKISSYFGSSSEENLKWKLYNADLSKVLAGSEVVGNEMITTIQTVNISLSAGIYYVKVYSDTGTGKYTYQYKKLAQDNCVHDYEKTWHDATYFRQGYYLYHCKRCGRSYEKDHVPVKKLAQVSISGCGSIGKGKIILLWESLADASGYQIRYAKKRNMKNCKTISIKGQSKSDKVIKKLSRNKKYYIQIRAYKNSGKQIAYSNKWSQKKSFRVR